MALPFGMTVTPIGAASLGYATLDPLMEYIKSRFGNKQTYKSEINPELSEAFGRNFYDTSSNRRILDQLLRATANDPRIRPSPGMQKAADLTGIPFMPRQKAVGGYTRPKSGGIFGYNPQNQLPFIPNPEPFIGENLSTIPPIFPTQLSSDTSYSQSIPFGKYAFQKPLNQITLEDLQGVLRG